MKKYLVLILCLGMATIVFGQKEKIKKADKLFNEFAYIDAIKVYQEIATAGGLDAYVCRQLAEANRRVGNSGQCENWYRMLIDMGATEPIDYYYYAQALKSNKKYAQAEKWIEKFRKLNVVDSRFKRELDAKSKKKLSFSDSAKITIENLSANSKFLDFSPTYFNEDKVVFVSSREEYNKSKSIYEWDKQFYLDLYVGERLENKQLINVKPFSSELNSPYHEGPLTFNDNFTTCYFTRNNLVKNKLKEDKEQTTNLKIYRTHLIGEKWGNIAEFKYNSDDYSTGHPSLSLDGNKLYFCSDKPGGYGGTDIYVCKWEKGEWGVPTNLGPSINTEGDEKFPFVHADSTLYFASDGLVGFGGLDIFRARQLSGLIWDVSNVGLPINSPRDDFGLIPDKDKKSGYFSSNRKGGRGYDDIYLFRCLGLDKEEMPDEISDLVNSSSEKFGAMVKLDSVKSNENQKIINDTIGNEPEKDYVDFEGKEIKVGETVVLQHIYYDLGKWDIRADAAKELNKIIRLMIKYPNMVLELSSHTDCRASFQYNMDLSQKRANSAIEYISTFGGIDKSRFVAKGYGETKLVNECADGVKCSEEAHQLNRRTEFVILKK
jgi:outer membrane protein OmpA-like peptidoglycan-associated protein